MERARREGEDDVIVGGQSGVGGGGDGGEDGGENGLFGGKEEEVDGDVDDIMVVVVVGMEEEMEEKVVKELVVEMEGRGGASWLAKEAAMAQVGLLFSFSGNKEEERMNNERERRSGGIYKG